MKTFVDIVNFNADASCLSSGRWLRLLRGGRESRMYEWLSLYATKRKKVVLGFPGATLADLARCNPETIDLINGTPEVFEVILRPFAHDIGLLRSRKGFALNFDYGRRAIRREFSQVSDFFLPPEFMLTNSQVAFLADQAVRGIFIHAERFDQEVRQRIPSHPYRLKGLLGRSMSCIPFALGMTAGYLGTLHGFDPSPWHSALSCCPGDTVFSWRDGESAFFLPDGQARETAWVSGEGSQVARSHLRDLDLEFLPSENLPEHDYHGYPVHSFSAWMKEFRMLGFVKKVQTLEENLERLGREQIHLWLEVIGSDILSSIEKRSPKIKIRRKPGDAEWLPYLIRRSERGFEGEEFLTILEALVDGDGARVSEVRDYLETSRDPHIQKMKNRLDYLGRLEND